jgi:hypothetical protein
MFTCLAIALIFALSTNGLVLAASNIGHQTHCIDAFDEAVEVSTVDEALSHDRVQAGHSHINQGLVAQHSQPNHDHETCEMHACAALSIEARKLLILAEVLLTKMSLPDRAILVFGLSDGLKRPPKA